MFGLSFASPLVLHALWAALIPVLVHLLNRRRSVTVAFSNVRMLQDLHHDRMRTIKTKQILLLLIRTLMIILLVLAFANPSIRGSSISSGSGRTSAVMLLDRSLSMRMQRGGGNRFDAARSRARQVLGLFVGGGFEQLGQRERPQSHGVIPGEPLLSLGLEYFTSQHG